MLVDGGDSEVRVSELAADDVERHAFPCHLDRMGVTQLVWGKATTDPCPGRGASQRDSDLRT
jgi:hypothetical protein